MQSSTVCRDLFTSLAGTVPLADVLSDLPLPSPLPTPIEQCVMGTKELSMEARKLLDNTNPTICSKITEALLQVDASFLDLKETSQTVPYTPNSKAPPLIKAVMSGGFTQPTVRLTKLDPSQYTSPLKTPSGSSASRTLFDSSVPLQAIQDSFISEGWPEGKTGKKKKRKMRPDSSSHFSENVDVQPKKKVKRRISSSSSGETLGQAKKHKSKPKDSSAHHQHLTVSIERDKISKKKLKKSLTSSAMTPAGQKSPLTKELTVKLSRVFYQGGMYTTTPPAGGGVSVPAVHSQLSMSRGHSMVDYYGGTLPLTHQHHGYEGGGLEMMREHSFMMSREMADQQVPSGKDVHRKKKKKKKKTAHYVGDPVKLANLQRFINMLQSLFDQVISDENLLSRPVVFELLSQVANLKHQGILHQVPVEVLVQLIGLMDKHVLDTANLQLNTLPDDVEAEPRVWRELVKDRILRSADSALVILHVTTAPNMPKNVHLEESIEQIISMTKYHLESNIYPQFDPVYKAENKESGALPRQKRRGGSGSNKKDIQAVYHKFTEVMENLALLIETQPLTDTTVLLLSSLGTFPFFVENVNLLQLSALRLVRAIFSRYEKHRDLILEDIFASLRRLPTTKRNLRSFKVSSGQHIQMVTALVLQLVQCIVVPPSLNASRSNSPTENEDTEKNPDVNVLMTNSYDLAVTTGNNFLSKFLKRCSGGKDEDDFRPLFDNFVQDLLATLNLPEWPASEVLLTLLGMLLVHSFSNRNNEQSLRLTSLEHLGVIAARLRKDAITSTEQDHEELVEILAQILHSKIDAKIPSPTEINRMDAFSENAQHLQKSLISYLNKRSDGDPACAFARDFYVGQWLYDTHVELEKALKENPDSPALQMEQLAMFSNFEGAPTGISSSAVALQQSETKKEMLHSLLDPKVLSSLKRMEEILNESSAAVVTRFLASSRALSKSFDTYLQKLIRVSNDPAVHVRTRAMKALSTIIAADPSILSRSDMQRAVEFRFRDTSTLVREAAVDLIGRFVLIQPRLTSQYYDMICERIRDSGVSVRKRVIKILKDICVHQPEFPKINDVCVRIIRRIGDEEGGIKQLVTQVFRELWFTSPPEGAEQKEVLLRRVTNIAAVVGVCKDYISEWFEQLFEQMLKTEDQAAVQEVFHVSQLMVDCLVERVLSLDENSDKTEASTSQTLISCIITLYLFCNIRPKLLLRHATTLHPYLSSSCAAQKDVMFLHFVAKILKDVVPLMEHPSESFLAGLEEDLVKLIMKQGQLLIHSCVECLGAVVNNVTHNFALVKDCFQRFYKCIEQMKALHSQHPNSPQLKTHRASLLRSVFTVGVLCKFFDLDAICPRQNNRLSRQVFSSLVYFFKNGDDDLQLKTVKGFGLFCIRYPELMLEEDVKQLYTDWLTKESHSSNKKLEVLRNLHNYLKEVEAKLKVADTEWSKESADKKNLLEFGDLHSSVSSSIAQTFLTPMLESFFSGDGQVRMGALQAVIVILRQGLVHPAQCLPYMIAMSTDADPTIKVKADQQLSEHTGRYGHIAQTHLMRGVKKSFEYQRLVSGETCRGYSTDNLGNHLSYLSHIYSLVRSTKQHRRAFLKALLRYFEDYEKNSVGFLLYLADNLAYLPYNTLEEPLFVVHHVDMTLSVTGSNILQEFKKALGDSTSSGTTTDDDEEDIHSLSQQNCNIQQLSECCHSCQSCFLLLLLKEHLKKSYGLSDSKCQKYSPTESVKAYDKTVSRKMGVVFDPQRVVNELKSEVLAGGRRPMRTKEDYLAQYLEFKKLMNKLDPFDEGEEGSDQEPPPPPPVAQQPAKDEPHQQNVELLAQQHQGDNTQQHKLPAPTAPIPRPPSRRSRSRASSISSIASESGSHKGRRGSYAEPKKKKRRRIILSSDESDNDPDYK